MPRQNREKTILNVIADTIGEPYYIGRRSQLLFTITTTLVGTCKIQARQKNEDWKDIASTAVSAEVNMDNYGWHEIRAITTGMGLGASVKVVWSWP